MRARVACEQFVQSFYTMALMHGGIGTPGHYFGWSGVKEFMSSGISTGAYCPVTADPANPLAPAGSPVYMYYPIPSFPTLVPGAVAIQDGAWFQIDEETGIDLGGCPNVLQAPKSSGGGCQAWTGTLVQVEKYTGDLTLEPDKNRPIVMPVGVE